MQSSHHWQKSPMQGAIPNQSPFTPADEAFLLETLTECRTRLQMALTTAQGYSRLPDLANAIGDAYTGCQEAEVIVLNPETYLE